MVDPLLKAYATPRQCEIIDAVNSQGGTAAAALAAVVRAINFTKRGGSTDAAWMQCGGA